MPDTQMLFAEIKVQLWLSESEWIDATDDDLESISDALDDLDLGATLENIARQILDTRIATAKLIVKVQ